MKKITINDICLAGLMAAAVYVTSAFLQIPIPTALDNTRLHLGNVMCLLSGFLLGPVLGGFAAGIGSAFFDITNPLYISSAPFTFAFKFFMAWSCGRIAAGGDGHKPVLTRYLVAGIIGNGSYVVLHLTKGFMENYFFLRWPLAGVIASTLQKGLVSTVNAIVAVAVAVPLALAMKPAIARILQADERHNREQ